MSPLTFSSDVPLVVVERAEKRYGSRVVLRIERLELRRQECLLIAGPNGSGKSTLLRVLSGVTLLSGGRLTRSREYDAMRICYVPQVGGFYQSLTVAENVRLWTRLFGSREPADLKSYWYIRGFGLEHHLNSRCRELSGGFQRLVSIACALSIQPDGLFLDEPLNGVDRANTKVFLEGITAARSALAFIVMTGHSEEDLSIYSRVVVLPKENAP